jgi:hypothetical protein
VKWASVLPNTAVKKRLIEQIDEQRAGLNFLIEMGLELPFVNVEKFGVLSEKSAEVGGMIGGWLKWASAN